MRLSPSTSSHSEPSIHVFPPVGGEHALLRLDALTLLMCALTLLHASKNKQLPLTLAAFFLGLSIEQLSIRLGGTHCHSSGVFDFSDCSSGNSVLFCAPHHSPRLTPPTHPSSRLHGVS